MKPFFLIIILSLFSLDLIYPLRASLTVIDPTSIRVNLANARKDLLEQIAQGKALASQVRNTVEQIRQIDAFLSRLGNPAEVRISTLKEAASFLEEIGLNKTSSEILGSMEAAEIFRVPPGGVHDTVAEDIFIGGKVVERRDPSIFAPEIASRRTLSHYRQIQAKVLEERGLIKAQMRETLAELRAATTSSEVAKLDVVMRSLEAQLASTDRELGFAANEVATRYFEGETEKSVQDKARLQYQRAVLREGTARDAKLYRFPTQPVLFKRRVR